MHIEFAKLLACPSFCFSVTELFFGQRNSKRACECVSLTCLYVYLCLCCTPPTRATEQFL